jgi:exonuclease VII small subunit
MGNLSLQEIREQLEEMKARGERSQGALDQILSRLKKEFGVNSLKEARKLLEAREKEVRKGRGNLDAAYRDFVKRYGELLGEA